MSHWSELRARARRLHDALRPAGEGVPAAAALLQAAAAQTGIDRYVVPAGDAALDGAEAVFDAVWNTIFISAAVPAAQAAFYAAHEYAHAWLGHPSAAGAAHCPDPTAAPESVPVGAQVVEGYSLYERREREANVFAREFLLPAGVLHRWYLEMKLTAAEIARRAGVPAGMVYHQLADALLIPEGVAGSDSAAELEAMEATTAPQPALDQSQCAAACAPMGPLLLQAGPGTGKTRTLVARIEALLQRGVAPSAILALTFSNRAAEEMRARVARVAPAAAPHLWMGTFHAFGLELLRKYGAHIGLEQLAVIDQVDALFLLEQALPELDLVHYQNLYEPAIYLRDLLAAISRAKDDLYGPDDYRGYAEQALREAATPEETTAAQKALEVARVYAVYQARLDARGLVDFGDLIRRAVLLLRQCASVRDELRRTYREVLVDEYQDVNHASTELLRCLAGDGRGLWVVGDARQAIYRFRGAAPENMRRFGEYFPGAVTLSLARNYRSQPAIVATVSEMAPRMRATAGTPFTPWESARPHTDGAVLMEVCDDAEAEGAAIARAILRRRDAGLPLREQAVLCRSHATLARIAASLERSAVPVLYLGDLFERPEIRDLLSLLALLCEPDGRALLRVARFAEYGVPLADVRALLALAREKGTPFPFALALAARAEGLSLRGREGLALLERHLRGLLGLPPWTLLARYLFDRSGYVRGLLADHSVAGQQRRLAVYQFLQFVQEGRVPPPAVTTEDPRRALLGYIRRLETFGEETQLRQVPAWADGIDAVRLLTVHASKGLEFSAVHIPALAVGRFPAARRPAPCPPPAGMLLHGAADAHEEEEECLFFVALSRARDVLHLSRARGYNQDGKTSAPSPLLALIAGHLPAAPPGGREAAVQKARAGMDLPPEPVTPPNFEADELESYLRCPRQYYYEHRLGLGRKRDDSAYVLFHRCVYDVLRWMAEQRAAGHAVNEAAVLEYLAHLWAQRGPTDHPFAAIYRRSAEAMVTRPFPAVGAESRPTWRVARRHGVISVTPDHVEWQHSAGARTLVVQRWRTGKPSKSEGDKDIYALYHEAARDAVARECPGAAVCVQIRYLSTDQVEPVLLKERSIATRLGHYDAAMAGIANGRFAPRPNERECPRCPHYFICPSAEDE